MLMESIAGLELLRDEVLLAKKKCDAACLEVTEKTSLLVGEITKILKQIKESKETGSASIPAPAPVKEEPNMSPLDPDFGPRCESLSGTNVRAQKSAFENTVTVREESVSSTSSHQLRSCLRSPTVLGRRFSNELMLSPRQRRLQTYDDLRKQRWGSPLQFIGTAGLRLVSSMKSGVLILTKKKILFTDKSGTTLLENEASAIRLIEHCTETDLIRLTFIDHQQWFLFIHSDTKSSSPLRLLDCLDGLPNSVPMLKSEMTVELDDDDVLQQYIRQEHDLRTQSAGEYRQASVNENANIRNEYTSIPVSDSDTDDSDTESIGGDMAEPDEASAKKNEFRGLTRISTNTRFIKLPGDDVVGLRIATTSPEIPTRPEDSPTSLESLSPVPSLSMLRKKADSPRLCGRNSINHITNSPGGYHQQLPLSSYEASSSRYSSISYSGICSLSPHSKSSPRSPATSCGNPFIQAARQTSQVSGSVNSSDSSIQTTQTTSKISPQVRAFFSEMKAVRTESGDIPPSREC
eukprot:TRINITY_DN11630_c0_g1_i1.p1 TRINITY_DN11630_c0_g1~~TRINITY_DN11630_c0_g1_i1.p1  ORF type:complete len:520 (+),score=86.59 TRINITY_DN11630_c0_g1_i1:121-1680(+)